MKRCEHCRTDYDYSGTACPSCASKDSVLVCDNCHTVSPQAYCPVCGTHIPTGVRPGASNTAQQPAQNTTTQVIHHVYQAPAQVAPVGKECNKMVALILCIFLGYFGAHKFYEGKTGMGIVYLFTAGLFGIGWIMDIIALVAKPGTYYI